MNMVAYVFVVVKFSVLAYQTRNVKSSHGEKIVLSVKLIFAFGLLWVFGLMSAAWRENSELSCIFVFLNGLSGVVLFLVFLCNKTVATAFGKMVSTRVSSWSSHIGHSSRTTRITSLSGSADASSTLHTTSRI